MVKYPFWPLRCLCLLSVFGVWFLTIDWFDWLLACGLSQTAQLQPIPWAPTETQRVFFPIVFSIISNGDSVLSSSTSATTKRFISPVLQVSLAYALGCQCCCWKSLSFSYSSTLWFVLYLSCVYLCMWVFISYTKRLRLSNGDMGFEISASKNCSN